MALCVFLYVLFEAMDSSDSALQLLTQYSPRQVVESRVESVLWQENGRMHWLRRHIIESLIRSCQLTIHEEPVQYSMENCGASIDYCHRPSVIVCDMETKFELLVVDCIAHTVT